MISVALVAAALAVFFGLDLHKLKAAYAWAAQRVDQRTAITAGLVLLAAALLPSWQRDRTPGPPPEPGPLSLRGAFVGETASQDAAIVGSLLCELADDIEWDGTQSEPFYRTGAQIDQLRKVARILRCKGESIGDRQPAARDQIASYLEEHIGTDGGPLTTESRSAWVHGLRDAGEAAKDAAQ